MTADPKVETYRDKGLVLRFEGEPSDEHIGWYFDLLGLKGGMNVKHGGSSTIAWPAQPAEQQKLAAFDSFTFTEMGEEKTIGGDSFPFSKQQARAVTTLLNNNGFSAERTSTQPGVSTEYAVDATQVRALTSEMAGNIVLGLKELGIEASKIKLPDGSYHVLIKVNNAELAKAKEAPGVLMQANNEYLPPITRVDDNTAIVHIVHGGKQNQGFTLNPSPSSAAACHQYGSGGGGTNFVEEGLRFNYRANEPIIFDLGNNEADATYIASVLADNGFDTRIIPTDKRAIMGGQAFDVQAVPTNQLMEKIRRGHSVEWPEPETGKSELSKLLEARQQVLSGSVEGLHQPPAPGADKGGEKKK